MKGRQHIKHDTTFNWIAMTDSFMNLKTIRRLRLGHCCCSTTSHCASVSSAQEEGMLVRTFSKAASGLIENSCVLVDRWVRFDMH
jgi:hypothetical protein